MGTRLEIYTHEKDADKIISIAEKFAVKAQVIGRVEEAPKKELVIKVGSADLVY